MHCTILNVYAFPLQLYLLCITIHNKDAENY